MKRYQIETGKDALAILAIIIAISLASMGGISLFEYLKAKYTQFNLPQTIEEVVKEANKDLPMMVDSGTRIDSVMAENNNIIYKYTVVANIKNDAVGIPLRRLVAYEVAKSQLCTDEHSKVIKAGVKFVYNYYDLHGALLMNFDIDKEDCLKYQKQLNNKNPR